MGFREKIPTIAKLLPPPPFPAFKKNSGIYLDAARSLLNCMCCSSQPEISATCKHRVVGGTRLAGTFLTRLLDATQTGMQFYQKSCMHASCILGIKTPYVQLG
jgi:hypothetical protein